MRYLLVLLVACDGVRGEATGQPSSGVVEIACPEIDRPVTYPIPWGSIYQAWRCDDGVMDCTPLSAPVTYDSEIRVSCSPGESYRIAWIETEALSVR